MVKKREKLKRFLFLARASPLLRGITSKPLPFPTLTPSTTSQNIFPSFPCFGELGVVPLYLAELGVVPLFVVTCSLVLMISFC